MDVDYLNGKVCTPISAAVRRRMDPKTGPKLIDHPDFGVKPDEAQGRAGIKPDPEGNLWASMMYQGGNRGASTPRQAM